MVLSGREVCCREPELPSDRISRLSELIIMQGAAVQSRGSLFFQIIMLTREVMSEERADEHDRQTAAVCFISSKGDLGNGRN